MDTVDKLINELMDLTGGESGTIDGDRARWVAETIRELVREEIRAAMREETK